MLYCPQYESLSISRILEQARKTPEINAFLPEDRDMHKVPRQWLINVAYTILGDPLRDWVKEEIVNRNEELAQKQNLLIEMDPEIARAFYSSVNISSKCHHHQVASTMLLLIICFQCSDEWHECSPPQGWFKAS